MRPYASTLHHLTVTGVITRNLELKDGKSLAAFSHLRTLHLKDVSIGDTCFCSALGAMPLLADLSIVRMSFLIDTPSPIFHCSLTRLTSFEFRLFHWRANFVWRWIEAATNRFVHLRRLSFDFRIPAYRLPLSETMTHLTVHIFYPMTPKQLLQMAEIMPRLESLEIHNYLCAFYIPSCMFVRMEGLRSLSLTEWMSI